MPKLNEFQKLTCRFLESLPTLVSYVPSKMNRNFFQRYASGEISFEEFKLPFHRRKKYNMMNSEGTKTYNPHLDFSGILKPKTQNYYSSDMIYELLQYTTAQRVDICTQIGRNNKVLEEINRINQQSKIWYSLSHSTLQGGSRIFNFRTPISRFAAWRYDKLYREKVEIINKYNKNAAITNERDFCASLMASNMNQVERMKTLNEFLNRTRVQLFDTRNEIYVANPLNNAVISTFEREQVAICGLANYTINMTTSFAKNESELPALRYGETEEQIAFNHFEQDRFSGYETYRNIPNIEGKDEVFPVEQEARCGFVHLADQRHDMIMDVYNKGSKLTVEFAKLFHHKRITQARMGLRVKDQDEGRFGEYRNFQIREIIRSTCLNFCNLFKSIFTRKGIRNLEEDREYREQRIPPIRRPKQQDEPLSDGETFEFSDEGTNQDLSDLIPSPGCSKPTGIKIEDGTTFSFLDSTSNPSPATPSPATPSPTTPAVPIPSHLAITTPNTSALPVRTIIDTPDGRKETLYRIIDDFGDFKMVNEAEYLERQAIIQQRMAAELRAMAGKRPSASSATATPPPTTPPATDTTLTASMEFI